jgi:hypothetical protein
MPLGQSEDTELRYTETYDETRGKPAEGEEKRY